MCDHNDNHCHNHNEEDAEKLPILKIVISLLLLVFAIFSHFEALKLGLFIASYLFVAFDIIKNAFLNILKGEIFDENFLMLVASFGAFCIGKYSEAIMVVLLYSIGEFLQDRAVDKSKDSISSLVKLKADSVEVLDGNEFKRKNPKDVKANSIILAKIGDKIALDGIIEDGEAMLDNSFLTGESLPKYYKKGDSVLSGAIVLDGLIKIKTTEEYKNSTVQKILDLVQKSAQAKTKTEKFITKFAKIYTPIVVFLALLLVVLPMAFGVANLNVWLFRALTFLVISCPCALVISVPLSFFCGVGRASKSGILIKGAMFIENLAKIKNVVFDKTGTLTKGEFKVCEVKSFSCFPKEEIIKIASSLEKFSNHPIAKSIVSANKNDDFYEMENVEEKMALGLFGTFKNSKLEGKMAAIGSYSLLSYLNLEVPENKNDFSQEIFLVLDNKIVGSLALEDEIKENSKKAILNFKKAGITTTMLTGDNKKIAQKVSKKLEIDDTHFELLPEDKVEIVDKIIKNKKNKAEMCAFIGDGINDAPVLKRADIGFAMGNMGSNSAIEAADIVLMDDNPYKVFVAIQIAKKTLRIVVQNITFALLIKAIFLLLGAFGYMTMWGAVFSDVGVTILAILNSLRIMYSKF